MKTVGIVACSDAQKVQWAGQNRNLVTFLTSLGCQVRESACIYEKHSVFSGTGRERAAELMKLFEDPEVEEIYDISGGDVANQVLDYLDYDAIAKSRAVFWGYSDLTTVINAIYAQTGKSSVLYQVKNMVYGDCAQLQRERFQNREELFSPAFTFVQGESMEGTVVGGNIRCFLKLAGTRYFPDCTGKVLLLESLGGDVPQMAAYLAQLAQMGVFDKITGVLLGTFTSMEAKGRTPDVLTLLKEQVPDTMPIAVTREIGHGNDSKAIRIGAPFRLKAPGTGA